MSDQTYERVKQVYYEAASLEPEAREAFIHAACAGDAALRLEVERLFAADIDAGTFLETPVLSSLALRDIARQSLEDAADPPTPERIGRYRIVRMLGEGGMGRVYEAEQETPRRRVALKVLRSGAMQSHALQRFHREVEVLGRLQHPGIARIYDAGVAEIPIGPGAAARVPYFAMELVEGSAITDFADIHHLTIRERLALLALTCDAVHHGHQHGVVHRDLKPANVLVGRAKGDATPTSQNLSMGKRDELSGEGSPMPKVIDFGVARVTNADIAATTLDTGAGQILGTLAYMSPEQVRGDPLDIDARSDIYALGVIGYQLLTGRMPYEVAHRIAPEAARIIRDEEPSRMSTISRGFRGDIETIFAKALEKEPSRRYESAAALADDIRRHLNDEPIIARQPTLGYQLRKFARRQKKFAAAMILAFLALAGGVVGTSIGLLRTQRALQTANDQREEAQRQANRAEQIKRIVKSMLLGARPGDRGGRDARIADSLDRISDELTRNRLDEPLVEMEIRATLGDTYEALGLFGEAVANHQRACELADQQLAADDPTRLRMACEYADVLTTTFRPQEAAAIFRELLPIARAKAGEHDELTVMIRGNLLRATGEYEAPAATFDAANALIRTLRECPESEWRTRRLSHTLYLAAEALNKLGRTHEAERMVIESLAVAATPPVNAKADLTGARRRLLSKLQMQNGDAIAAADTILACLNDQRTLLQPHHTDLMLTAADAAVRLRNVGRHEEEVEIIRDYADYTRTAYGASSHEHFVALNATAYAQSLAGKYADEAATLRHAIALRREVGGEGDQYALIAWRAAQLHNGLDPLIKDCPEAILASLDMLRDSPMAMTPITFAVDEVKWKDARFELRRWSGGENDDAAAPTLKLIASGMVTDLAKTPDPPSGLYLMRATVPGPDGQEHLIDRWFAVGPWILQSSSLSEGAIEAWPNTPVGESMAETSHSRTMAMLTWALRAGQRGLGPNNTCAFYRVQGEASIDLPPGEYRLTLTVDDCARVWHNGELVIDDWELANMHQRTCVITSKGGGDALRVDYVQARDAAVLDVEIVPMAIAVEREKAETAKP